MTVVLDAGGLLADESGDRNLMVLLTKERPTHPRGVVGQVWRGGSGRQANLAKALKLVDTAHSMLCSAEKPARSWRSAAPLM